jgi:hypothetical protein
MALDSNIILSIGQNAQQQPPPNLLGQYHQAQQIQANRMAMAAQQQNYQTAGMKQQQEQMALAQQQQAAQQQQDLIRLLQQNGGDVKKTAQQAIAQGNTQGFALQKNADEAEQLVAKTKKDAEDAAKTHLETTQRGLDRIGSMADRVLTASPELQGVAYQSIRLLAHQMQIPGADQLPPAWGEEAQSRLLDIQQGAVSRSEQIKDQLAAGRDVETGRHNRAGETLAKTKEAGLERFQGAQIENMNAGRQLEARRLQQSGARLGLDQQAQASTLNLSPEATTNAAQLYNQTGQLPPMGMGKQGAAVRSSILNRAAELSGVTNLAANKADYKADAASLSGLTKMRDAVTAFEDTAGKNLDLFLEQAKGIIDSGSPAINAPLRFGAKLAGSGNQAAYAAARQVAINEIAKVTSNPTLAGQLSDSARHEVAAFSPENASLKQIYAVAKVLKQDMENRRITLDSKINEVHGRLKGSPSTQSSGAASGVAVPPGPTSAPGVPSVGAMFNGEKVLKVTKVK